MAIQWLTDDEVAIVPGLRVFTIDCVWGTVEATQFKSGSALDPGGEHFNGMFRVAMDNDQGEPSNDIRIYNGERMSTVRPAGLR